MKALFRRFAHFIRRSHHDAELREEIETHRALRQDALEREGLTSNDAAQAKTLEQGYALMRSADARDTDPNAPPPKAGQDVGGYNAFWIDPGTHVGMIGAERRSSWRCCWRYRPPRLLRHRLPVW